jgi:formylglycine-generating enzyme required for sulfatase activity
MRGDPRGGVNVRQQAVVIAALFAACFGGGETPPPAQGDQARSSKSDGPGPSGPKEPAPKVDPPPEPLPPSLRCEDKEADSTCFVRVEGARFAMGAQSTDPNAPGYDPHARPDEGPVHEVQISSFRIQRVEVSASSYRRCVDEGWCSVEDLDTTSGLSTWSNPESRSALSGVSWFGASRYCAWLGARLPTEAEWELAARGTDGRPFPWGPLPRCGVQAQVARDQPQQPEDVPELTCNQTGPVPYGDLRGRSPYGASGMAGNLWEWTADWYAPDAYAKSAAVDPTGPAEGTLRVQRGGGWSSAEVWELRSAGRGAMDPTATLPDVGFRCARAERQ